jgi:hypothetical protein
MSDLTKIKKDDREFFYNINNLVISSYDKYNYIQNITNKILIFNKITISYVPKLKLNIPFIKNIKLLQKLIILFRDYKIRKDGSKIKFRYNGENKEDNLKELINFEDITIQIALEKFIEYNYDFNNEKYLSYETIFNSYSDIEGEFSQYNNKFYTQIYKYKSSTVDNVNQKKIIEQITSLVFNFNIDGFIDLKSHINFDYDKKKDGLYKDKQYILIKINLFYPIITLLINKLTDELKGENINFTSLNNDSVLLQKVEINKNSRTLFVGDFHSSFESLFNMIENNKEMFINDGDNKPTFKLKDNCYIFFLGDIIDRGPFSIELLFFIMVIKIINFNNVYIIRGNHEDTGSSAFKEEYSTESKEQLYTKKDKEIFINVLFSLLPSCIYLYNGKKPGGIKKWIHLSHGAFNPKYIKDTAIKDYLLNDELKYFILEEDIDISNSNNDFFKWGDFYLTYENQSLEDIDKNGRQMIGHNYTQEYCKNNNILCIISGHQDFENILIMPTDIKTHVESIINNKMYKSRINNIEYENEYFRMIFNIMDYFNIDINYNNFKNLKQLLSSKNIDFVTRSNNSGIINTRKTFNDDKIYKYTQRFMFDDEIDYGNYYDLFELVNDNKDGELKSYNLPEPGREFLALTTSTAKIARDMCCDCWIVMENDYV